MTLMGWCCEGSCAATSSAGALISLTVVVTAASASGAAGLLVKTLSIDAERFRRPPDVSLAYPLMSLVLLVARILKLPLLLLLLLSRPVSAEPSRVLLFVLVSVVLVVNDCTPLLLVYDFVNVSVRTAKRIYKPDTDKETDTVRSDAVHLQTRVVYASIISYHTVSPLVSEKGGVSSSISSLYCQCHVLSLQA
jgi:hypothetical protein